MRDRFDELTSAKATQADVVVITFTKPRNLAGYRRRFADPFTVTTDQARELYQAMGFGRGTVWRIWGLRAANRYRQLLRSGHKLERASIDSTGEDTLQLGGNVVVDSEGQIAWVYHGRGPDDRPTVDEIVRQVRQTT